VLERGGYDRPVFFDPCAGTGSALVALAADLLNGRQLAPNDGNWLPLLLAEGTFTRTQQSVDHRSNGKGGVTGEVCVQQRRLDLLIVRLDTLTFQQLALVTEPFGAPDLDGFNTGDLPA